MIEVQNISFSIGCKKLLEGINFEINPGEMLAIIGANGAGKSTLMKLLCGDIEPSGGTVLFNNENITSFRKSQLARMRSVLAQHNTISMSFTVRELVLMGRYPHFTGQPSEQDIRIIKEVMFETGIDHLASRDYNTLSGGEQQRVQLARVIAQIYDVPNGFLFLDEPTNGLDLLYQQQILSMARNMANRNYCVICILHDINFASRYADKIMILKDGKIVDMGPPLKVINHTNIYEAFNIKVKLMAFEDFECPMIIPEMT